MLRIEFGLREESWRTPTRGRLAIFDWSRNRRVVSDRLEGQVKGKGLPQAFEGRQAEAARGGFLSRRSGNATCGSLIP
jgi:hypothetical protein